MNILKTLSPITSLLSIEGWISCIIGIIGLTVAWLVGSFLKKNLLKLSAPAGYSTLFILLGADILKMLCVSAGVLFFMGTLGINIGAIIKLIAFLGVGISFIFKDILSDIVSGFFIVAHKPFTIGLEITVTIEKGVYTGKIKSIDLRYITLENPTQLILVPNSYLFHQPLCISKNK